MEKSGWIVTTSNNKYVGYPEEEGIVIHIMIKSQKSSQSYTVQYAGGLHTMEDTILGMY